MLRRTNLSLIAPLPLYKVAIVLIRQFSRPVVVQAVEVANDYPHIRRGLIWVGWHHYRVGCHLYRLIWGAEQQQAKDEQTTTTTTANAENSSHTTTATLNPAVAEKIKEEITMAAEPPLNAAVGIAAIGGVKNNSNVTSSGKSQVVAADEGEENKGPKIVSTRRTVVSTSPGMIKALPSFKVPSSSSSSSSGFNPLRKVRNIFVAPPRPSDEELLKKGMTLVIETLMFVFVCLIVLYEMKLASDDKKAKRLLMEERFVRLESHIVHFPGCGCPEGGVDGQPPLDEELDKGLAKLIPDREKVKDTFHQHVSSSSAAHSSSATTAAATTSSSSSVTSGVKKSEDGKIPTAQSNWNSRNQQKQQQEQSSSSTTAATTMAGVETVPSSAISTTTTNSSSSSSLQQKKHYGQLARMPTCARDLMDFWYALPVDVQVAVFSVFVAPYCLMFALVLRLFVLVRRNQIQG
jgi:hypothetical protein